MLLWDLIQTRPMQRLRRIKQLGLSDYVYPGASHSRLSHSIGAVQMARRMFVALERNRQLSDTTLSHEKLKSATLVSVLLHDLGHGPYSHVFEDISHEIGFDYNHEQVTTILIDNSEIRAILDSHNLYDDVRQLRVAESGADAYSNIISSQLDADRLDFLVRDRYFTGVKFGAIDLDWLLDCLRIAKIPISVDSSESKTIFTLSEKALPAIEVYISTYQEMYTYVYFHKTTRSVQYMVKDVATHILKDSTMRKSLAATMPIAKYCDEQIEERESDLNTVLSLDDDSLLGLVRHAAANLKGEVQEIAQRMLDRKLYKCFEIPKRPKEPPSRGNVAKFIEQLEGRKIKYHKDVLPKKSYNVHDADSNKYLKNILIWSAFDNDYKIITEISPSIQSLVNEAPARFYFRSESDHQTASAIWSKI